MEALSQIGLLWEDMGKTQFPGACGGCPKAGICVGGDEGSKGFSALPWQPLPAFPSLSCYICSLPSSLCLTQFQIKEGGRGENQCNNYSS